MKLNARQVDAAKPRERKPISWRMVLVCILRLFPLVPDTGG